MDRISFFLSYRVYHGPVNIDTVYIIPYGIFDCVARHIRSAGEMGRKMKICDVAVGEGEEGGEGKGSRDVRPCVSGWTRIVDDATS